MSSAVLLSQPVVIDNGTAILKAGFAGGDRPTVVFDSICGRVKHERVMPGGALEGVDVVIGDACRKHRGALVLSRPMESGRVTDWADVERVWSHAYNMIEASYDGHPLLMTEAPLNPDSNREKCAEVLFEHLGVPALHIAPQAALSLYAGGRTTGLVLDIGDGVAQAVPVYEGLAVRSAVVRSEVGGRAISKRLELLLRRAGFHAQTSAEKEVVREIKEACCYVSADASRDEHAMSAALARKGTLPSQNLADAQPRSFRLPDGSSVRLEGERFRASEALFDPSVIGSEEPGAAELVALACRRADLDLRATLYESVVLAGGSTLFPGFGERLVKDLRSKLPDTTIRVRAPPERALSCWIGGSILASLATFKSMWVLRSEYDEHGASVFSRGAL